MNIDMKALKGIIEEIEASKVRQKGESEFQREAIKRAVKQHQLDGKAIRIVLQRRAMGDEKRDEQDYYVHAYEMALGGKKLAADALASGATVREAAAIGGISTGAAGNLAKVVQKSEKMDKPEDGDDGITVPTGGPVAVRNEGGSHDARQLSNSRRHQTSEDDTVDESLAAGVAAQVDGDDDGVRPRGVLTPEPEVARAAPLALPADEAPAPRSVGAVAASSPRVAPPFLGDDPGPPTDFLRGSRTAQGRGA